MILSELNAILSLLIPVETGVFSDTAPDKYAAQVERKKRAKSLGRDHFVSESPIPEVPTEFSIQPALQHFDDPK